MGEHRQWKLDACMKIVEFRTKRIDGRRNHEWKVTLGLWAILAAAVVKRSDLEISEPHLHWGLAAIVLGHAFLWVRTHWVRSKEDTYIAFKYSDYARKILAGRVEPPPAPELPKFSFFTEYLEFLTYPTCLAQIGTTGLLAFFVAKCH